MFSKYEYAKIANDTNGTFVILIIIAIVILIAIFFYIKHRIWDEPHEKINFLQKELDETKKQIDFFNQFGNTNKYKIAKMITDFEEYDKYNVDKLIKMCDLFENVDKERAIIIIRILHKYNRFEINRLSNLLSVLENENQDETLEIVSTLIKRYTDEDLSEVKETVSLKNKILLLENRIAFLESTQSNLTAIPYMSQIIADYETYGLENLASQLDWGYDYQRLKKVKSIREIRKDAKDMVEKNKEAQYQLAYLLELFPSLNEIIEADFNQLPPIKVEELTEYDKSKDYLTKEEYQALSVTERNQLALDRYKTSHNRSKWQIGRDYELYIGYQCSLKGYSVDYFGSYKGLEDLGRDLIVQKNDKTFIIQCKYWSNKKKIHEKHITQLYGTMMSYCVENDLAKSKVHGVLVTNITLSETAKQMANFLKIKHYENVKSGDYPCIKCNINNNGEKIYHLPFDQKYDVTKIDKKGEFFATTVVEAEEAGFRRALKWFG